MKKDILGFKQHTSSTGFYPRYGPGSWSDELYFFQYRADHDQ